MNLKSTTVIFVAALITFGSSGCSETVGTVAFVPTGFDVPQEMEAETFHLYPLKVSDAEADYEAVMESRQDLRAIRRGLAK
ncbi:MAG: hypothetical protein R3C03_14455 [Pirellulaceae bacterium]